MEQVHKQWNNKKTVGFGKTTPHNSSSLMLFGKRQMAKLEMNNSFS